MITISNEWNKVVRIDWSHPTDSYYYLIKQDGKRIGKTTSDRYYAHYLEEGTTYSFEVVKVDENDVETTVGSSTATTTTAVNYGGAEPKIINAGVDTTPAYNITDATLAYRAAINSANTGDIVQFKNGTGDNKWRIGSNVTKQFVGTSMAGSHITILIDEGVEFNAIDGTWTDELDMLMRFDRVTGLRILGYNAKLYLRSSNFAVNFQSRMAIAFYNCLECTVEGLEIDGSGGDAIYMGNLGQNVPANVPAPYSIGNERLLIYNTKATNQKRAGYSHDSIKRLVIAHAVAENTGAVYSDPNLFNWSYENNYPLELMSEVITRYALSRNAHYSGVGINMTKTDASSPLPDIKFYDMVLKDNWSFPGGPGAENQSGTTYKKRRDFHIAYGGALGGSVQVERMLMKDSPSTGIGYSDRTNRMVNYFKDISILNPVSYTPFVSNAFFPWEIKSFGNGAGVDIGNINLDGAYIFFPQNQHWLGFPDGSADSYNISNVSIENTLVVTPHVGTDFYSDPAKTVGTNYVNNAVKQVAIPAVTVSIEVVSNAVRGKDYGEIKVTRDVALAHPTSVDLTFSGAVERDDYDFLPPGITIPSGALEHSYPIKARLQDKPDDILSVTIENSPYYSIGVASANVLILDCETIITPTTNSKTRAGNLLGGMLTYRSIR